MDGRESVYPVTDLLMVASRLLFRARSLFRPGDHIVSSIHHRSPKQRNPTVRVFSSSTCRHRSNYGPLDQLNECGRRRCGDHIRLSETIFDARLDEFANVCSPHCVLLFVSLLNRLFLNCSPYIPAECWCCVFLANGH